MRIVADENVDKQIVDCLREHGYSVTSIVEMDPGIDDEAVLDASRQEDAILITADKDFGELVFRQGLLHRGILLLRLAGLEPEAKAALVLSAMELHAEELALGFAVLSARTLRIRKRSG